MMNNVVLAVIVLCLVGVRTNDLFLGDITPRSRLLVSEVHQALMAPWRRIRHLTVQGHADEVISAIRVFDLKKGKDGIARLDGGEIGGTKIILGLRSAGPFRGYAFKVEIYAERLRPIPDLESNPEIADLVRNITKTMLEDALSDIVESQEDGSEDDDVERPQSTTKKTKIKKRKKKKPKINRKRKTEDKNTFNIKKYFNTSVEKLMNTTTAKSNFSKPDDKTSGKTKKKSMFGTESKFFRGDNYAQVIPPLSGVYSRWTQLSLPSVRISDDLAVQDVATPFPMPGAADVNFQNLLTYLR